MTRMLWILAVVTLAVQLASWVFGGAIERALAAAGWPALMVSTTFSLVLGAPLIVTAVAGVYAAGKAHHGGWVALFGVALMLGLYGQIAAEAVVPRLGVGRVLLAFYGSLGLVLELLVPLAALAYALRYRPGLGAPAPARADGR